MTELLLRFLIGGIAVAAFSFIGCLFKPKSFAGLFGAAPSIALATLAITVGKRGSGFAAVEAYSMIGGAIAFFLCASVTSAMLMTKRFSTLHTTAACLTVWFTSAFLLWRFWLR